MTLQRPFALPIALPRGPEHYWKVMQKLNGKGFTIRDVAWSRDGVAYKTVEAYMRFLLKEGIIVKVGARNTGGAPSHVYKIKTPQRRAPVQRRELYSGKLGQIQLALWTAMRTLASFTLPELVASASTEELPIKTHTANTYVLRLIRAGAVEVITPYRKAAPGATGARAGTYRLRPSANTGPQPLKIFDAKIVFDPNKNRVLGEVVVTET
jgi:hypothetical protein